MFQVKCFQFHSITMLLQYYTCTAFVTLCAWKFSSLYFYRHCTFLCGLDWVSGHVSCVPHMGCYTQCQRSEFHVRHLKKKKRSVFIFHFLMCSTVMYTVQSLLDEQVFSRKNMYMIKQSTNAGVVNLRSGYRPSRVCQPIEPSTVAELFSVWGGDQLQFRGFIF